MNQTNKTNNFKLKIGYKHLNIKSEKKETREIILLLLLSEFKRRMRE